MSLIVLLDSSPLGLVTNPKELVPAITDYEVRRELRLYGKINGLKNLDALVASTGYLPLTPQALWLAADFWAQARQAGMPTAERFALDADMILAAQAKTLDACAWEMPGASIVIATSNIGHLARFADARQWSDIAF